MGIDLTRTAIGDQVQGPLLVCEVEQRGNREQPFAVLTLGNSTGRIDSAPFWPETLSQIAGISKGDIVEVLGDVTLYRDRRQLRVSSIRGVPEDTTAWREMLPTAGDATPCWEALDGWRAEIAGSRLKTTLALFFEDEEFRGRFADCPASVQGHHAVLGGLLRHTWEVASIARTICRSSPADIDLVLAGALLHDMGKLEAYRWTRGFDYTARGHLYGHVALGSIMLERRVRRVALMPCTEAELDILHHLVLSHHGKHEHGAPVRPMTLEAEVLHFADDASARTDSMSHAVAASENFAGDQLISSRSIWQLDRRRVYRGRSDWGDGTRCPA